MRTPADPSRALRTIASARLPVNEAVFGWCLRNARLCMGRSEIEPALRWSLLAAKSAIHHGFGWLASPELESVLLAAATRLPRPTPRHTYKSESLRWLHVLDRANSIGGHSALVQRWIELDSYGNRHSVVFLSQRGAIDSRLVEAVRAGGGSVRSFDPDELLTERARWLREEAWNNADRVVLHVHPWSVLPVVALGVPDGPPVMLLNHLSQKFWVGGSVADLVLNLRPSALEWSEVYRGIDRNAILPIPILDSAADSHGEPLGTEHRSAARRSLGLPSSSVVFLTIGSAYKYQPLPGMDFLEAVHGILRARPDAYVVAVGPQHVGRWAVARSATAGHIIPRGQQPDLRAYHAAADIYLEGFPIGSPTALLEACQIGIPCVRAPRCVPSPFSMDGAAVAGVERPADVAEYVRKSIELLDDEQERRRQGLALKAAIQSYHCSSSWRRELTSVLARLPQRHEVHSFAGTAPLRGYPKDFSIALAALFHADDTLTYTFRAAWSMGLQPGPSFLVARALWQCIISDPRAFARRRVIGTFLEPIVGPRVINVMRRVKRHVAARVAR